MRLSLGFSGFGFLWAKQSRNPPLWQRQRKEHSTIGSALRPKQRFFDKNLVLCVKTRSFLGTTLAISKTRFLDVPGMLEGEGFFCEAIWDEYKSVLTVCG